MYLLRRLLLRDEHGQDLIEYALLIAFIALVAVSAVGGLGQAVYDVLWNDLGPRLGLGS